MDIRETLRYGNDYVKLCGKIKVRGNNMPYGIRKRGEVWEIYRKEDGRVVGKSESEEKARASVRARLAAEHGWRKEK